MIQLRTRLDVADNTGARMATMIGVIGKATSTARMSATVLIPPPTENGMAMLSATRSTTSRKMPRPSAEAVMS